MTARGAERRWRRPLQNVQSSTERREIVLDRQVTMPDEHDAGVFDSLLTSVA
jgi:hypothetical protein